MKAVTVRSVLDVAATVGVIAAAVAVVWQVIGRQGAGDPPSRPFPIGKTISLQDVPLLGSSDAAVLMVEVADFQCPYCLQFARDVLPGIRQRYVDSGRVALGFLQLPSPQHGYARQAAVASECARQQGRFWQFYDSIFALDKITSADVDQAALRIGVDRERFQGCLSADAAKRIDTDVAVARRLQIGSTPTFLIGLRTEKNTMTVRDVVVGARGQEHFGRALDSYIKQE